MKLSHIPIVIIAALSVTGSYGQISNSNNPHPSAALDLEAANKGLLLPRVRLTGLTDTTTIPAPATSLMVYNTNAVTGMPVGFYSWNGTRWESLSNEPVTHTFTSTGNTLTGTINGIPKSAEIINTNTLTLSGINLTSTVNGKVSTALSLATLAGWGLNGNAIGTATSFIGTSDNQPLRFRTNNSEKMTILGNGNVGIGTTAPAYGLHVQAAAAAGYVAQFSNSTNVHGAVYVRDTNEGTTGIAGSYFGTRTNHGTNIMTNAVSRIAITNAGRIGIGHNDPTYTLDVVSTTNDELLASFQPQNRTQGIAIGYSGISKIAATADSDLKISPKGNGKVNIDGPALVKTLPAGTVGEQVVVVDSNNNLKKIAAASVGKTYTGGTGITVAGTVINATTTNTLALTGTNLTSTVNGVPSNALNLATVAGWSLTGNAIGTAANFIGTTDNQPLRIHTNNTERMRLDGNGRLALGTITPTTARLTVNGLPSVGILASFRDGNSKAGFDIDWTALNRIDTDNANSNFNINAKGTGAVVLNKAIVSNLPAGTAGEQVVVVDGSNNLKKIASTSVGKTYTGGTGITVTGTVISATTTNLFSSAANAMTSNVNTVPKTANIINSSTMTSTANTIRTTINGVASATVPLINTNTLGLSGTTLSSAVNGVNSTQNLANSLWSLTGNAATTAQFIGTTNTNPLNIRVNNTQRASFTTAGMQVTGGIQATGTVNGKYFVFDPATAGAATSFYMSENNSRGVLLGIGVINGSYNLNIEGPMRASSFNNSSDRRLKKDIHRITGALDKIKNIEGVRYLWRREEFKERNFKEGYDLGVIAQDIQSRIPEAVTQEEDGFYAVTYTTLIPVLIEAVKEQQVQIEVQQQQLQVLEAQSKQQQEELQELRKAIQELRTQQKK